MNRKISPFKPITNLNEDLYLPDEGLEAAIDVALDLGMPLLLTGEPGTGKTRLAYYLANKLGQGAEDLLIFNTKTTSTAKDLLYRYDTISHFRDAQIQKNASTENGKSLNTMDYVSFEALGQAILDSKNKRYVVLIDEIDKAPRDFPNDVLFEFEHLSFKVEEASKEEVAKWLNNKSLEAEVDKQGFFRLADLGEGQTNRPILILTSNSEKNLPDAFLRRCVYYHIPFPSSERLKQIVESKINLSKGFTEKMLKDAVNHFVEIRENKGLRKKPATAELLAWMHHLHKYDVPVHQALANDSEIEVKKQLLKSYSILAKNKEDLLRLAEDLGVEW